MRKFFVFVLSILIIYLIFSSFFRNNILDDCSFPFDGRWTCHNAAFRNNYVRFENQSYIRQNFNYPMLPGSKFKVKFSARNQHSKGNTPYILLYIDGICYSIFKIHSSEWREYVSYFSPLCYSFYHNITIKMINGSLCDVKNLYLKTPTLIDNDYIFTQKINNLIINGDFSGNTNHWNFSFDHFYFTNIFGLNSLAIKPICTNFLFSSEEYELEGGKDYLISSCYFSDNNKIVPSLFFGKKLSAISNNNISWVYNELLLSTITNYTAKFSVSIPNNVILTNGTLFFTNFKINDLSSINSTYSFNKNLLLNNCFSNGFSNWKGSLSRFSISTNFYRNTLLLNNIVNYSSTLSQDFNVISGAYYSFQCDFKYLSDSTNGSVAFIITYLDDNDNKIYREFFHLNFNTYNKFKWHPFSFSFSPKVSSKASFTISPRNTFDVYLDNMALFMLKNK